MKKMSVAALLLLMVSWPGAALADYVYDVKDNVLTGSFSEVYHFDLTSIANNFLFADLYIDVSEEMVNGVASNPQLTITVGSQEYSGSLSGMTPWYTDGVTGLNVGWFYFDITDLLKNDDDKIIDISIDLSSGTFKLIDFYAETTPVPEPTTMLLFGTGLAGLAALGRRKVIN